MQQAVRQTAFFASSLNASQDSGNLALRQIGSFVELLLRKQVPVLFALREPQLFELARCMRNHAVAAGQVVFRQGDPGAPGFACMVDGGAARVIQPHG